MTIELESKKDLVNEKVTRHDGSQENAPSPLAGEGEERSDGGVGFPHNDVCAYTKPKCELTLTMDKYEPRPCGCNTRKLVNNRFPARKGWGLRDGKPQSLISSNHSTHFTHLTHFKKAAFTLAEVLITLAVIGIVAAMTIPTLVNNYQEKVFVTGAKKFYSLISQAVQLAVIDNGLPENWDLSDPENMIKPLMPYLKITDYCTSTNGKVCYNKKIYFRDGTLENVQQIFSGTLSIRPAFRLSDGTNVGVFLKSESKNSDSTIYGEYMVDVNGEKGPNTYGKDIFIFNLIKNGTIKPSGTPDTPANTIYTFDNGCLNSNATGYGCPAWVVQNGNMDYWHCDDLSWDGKHKCSD